MQNCLAVVPFPYAQIPMWLRPRRSRIASGKGYTDRIDKLTLCLPQRHRTPELGTQAMVDGMKQMLPWHLEAFDVFPIGDGYEVDVNEFDWKDENGVYYEKNGVTVRHWRRSHAKDGATAYRLDWNGLSFVWTGDGRPDELTTKYSKGANVPHPKQLLGLGDGPLPDEVRLPKPRQTREDQQEQYTRDNEIEPEKYYPSDVYREPGIHLPEDLKFTKQDLDGMIAARPDSD